MSASNDFVFWATISVFMLSVTRFAASACSTSLLQGSSKPLFGHMVTQSGLRQHPVAYENGQKNLPRHVPASARPGIGVQRNRRTLFGRQEVDTPVEYLRREALVVSCAATNTSKQSCLFNNVCLLPSKDLSTNQSYLTAVLLAPVNNSNISSSRTQHALNILTSHLNKVMARQRTYRGVVVSAYSQANFFEVFLQPHARPTNGGPSGSLSMARGTLKNGTNLAGITSQEMHTEPGLTILWSSHPENQGSFGHALVNEAFPLSMVLNNHFDNFSDMPRNVQLLIAADSWNGHALPHVLKNIIAHDTQLLAAFLTRLQEQGKAGVCLRHLLVGDGGYVSATRASLANSGQHEAYTYSKSPSFFDSKNWRALRTYSMQVAGVLDKKVNARPLILLNDKRFHGTRPDTLGNDRRMILNIEQLATEIKATYPSADVVPVRFRDLTWPDQLRLLSQAVVFITTQGSSAFRLVWLPPGAACIMIGSPKAPVKTEWKSYHELDRWFPLSYIQYHMYEIDHNKTDDYVLPAWSTNDIGWWYYNADVRVRMERLRPILGQILGM